MGPIRGAFNLDEQGRRGDSGRRARAGGSAQHNPRAGDRPHEHRRPDWLAEPQDVEQTRERRRRQGCFYSNCLLRAPGPSSIPGPFRMSMGIRDLLAAVRSDGPGLQEEIGALRGGYGETGTQGQRDRGSRRSPRRQLPSRTPWTVADEPELPGRRATRGQLPAPHSPPGPLPRTEVSGGPTAASGQLGPPLGAAPPRRVYLNVIRSVQMQVHDGGGDAPGSAGPGPHGQRCQTPGLQGKLLNSSTRVPRRGDPSPWPQWGMQSRASELRRPA